MVAWLWVGPTTKPSHQEAIPANRYASPASAGSFNSSAADLPNGLYNKLDFVRFLLRPDPEEAVICDVAKGLIEGQDAAADVVEFFPFSPV